MNMRDLTRRRNQTASKPDVNRASLLNVWYAVCFVPNLKVVENISPLGLYVCLCLQSSSKLSQSVRIDHLAGISTIWYISICIRRAKHLNRVVQLIRQWCDNRRSLMLSANHWLTNTVEHYSIYHLQHLKLNVDNPLHEDAFDYDHY